MRCPKGFVQKPPKSGNCIAKTKKNFRQHSRRRKTRKSNMETVYYFGRNVEKNIPKYFERHVFNKSADQFRKIAVKHDLYYGLDANDDKLKDDLVDDILQLAGNLERDYNQREMISLRAVKYVINDDEEIRTLFNQKEKTMRFRRV
jgi:hypothetical protein